MPFLDLKQHYRSIKDKVNVGVQQVMDGCRFVLGENVESFEKEFASFCGTEYAVGVANGADILRLTLLAWRIEKGDEEYIQFIKRKHICDADINKLHKITLLNNYQLEG